MLRKAIFLALEDHKLQQKDYGRCISVIGMN